MPKRYLSIRKNSRSNKNKNKIPKKSKKPVIKKGVKGKGKIKGRAKVNKRVVKSKHLQRKHSKNKKEKKRNYRLFGGSNFSGTSNHRVAVGGMNSNGIFSGTSKRVAVGGMKLAKLQVLFEKIALAPGVTTRSGGFQKRVENSINDNNNEPRCSSGALTKIAQEIAHDWTAIINRIAVSVKAGKDPVGTKHGNLVDYVNDGWFPYQDANCMKGEWTEEYFATIMRDLATKNWDTSTAATNRNNGGGAVIILQDIYNRHHNTLSAKFIEEMDKVNYRGRNRIFVSLPAHRQPETLAPAYIFNNSYNYNRGGGSRYCYISSRINNQVNSLEHLFPFFDDLFVGVLPSVKLMVLAKSSLGTNDFATYEMLVLLLHPLAAFGPNERKSNQALLQVKYDNDNPNGMEFAMLEPDKYMYKPFGRTGTAGWWGLRAYIGNPGESQIRPTNGGWHNKGVVDLPKELIINNQNVFIQTVINTANQLLQQASPRLRRFLLLWQAHMCANFSYPADDEFKFEREVADLERLGALDDVNAYCDDGNQGCENYINKAMNMLNKGQTSPRSYGALFSGPPLVDNSHEQWTGTEMEVENNSGDDDDSGMFY